MGVDTSHPGDARENAQQLYEKATNSDFPNSIHLEKLVELLKHNPGLLIDTYIDLAIQAASINVGISSNISHSAVKYPVIKDSDSQGWYLIIMGLWGFDVLDEAINLPQDLFAFSAHKKIFTEFVRLISSVIETNGTPVVIAKRAIQSLSFLYPILFKFVSTDNSARWADVWQDVLKISSALHGSISVLHGEQQLFISLCKYLSTEVSLFIPTTPPKSSLPQSSELLGIDYVSPNHPYLNVSKLAKHGESSIVLVFDLMTSSLETATGRNLTSLMGFSSAVLLLVESRPALCDLILPKFMKWVSLVCVHNDESSLGSSFLNKCLSKNLGIMLYQLFRLPRMEGASKTIEQGLKQIKSRDYELWLTRQERIKERERQKEALKEAEMLKLEKEKEIERQKVLQEAKLHKDAENEKLLDRERENIRQKILEQEYKNHEMSRILSERQNQPTELAQKSYQNNGNSVEHGKRKRASDSFLNERTYGNNSSIKTETTSNAQVGTRNNYEEKNNYLSETINSVLRFNKDQVINLVLQRLSSISHEQIQQSKKASPHQFETIFAPQPPQNPRKPKGAKTRWSQETPFSGFQQSVNVLPEQLLNKNGLATIYGVNQTGIPNIFDDGIQHDKEKMVPSLDLEIDEEALNLKLEEGANRVQYTVDTAEEIEDIPLEYDDDQNNAQRDEDIDRHEVTSLNVNSDTNNRQNLQQLSKNQETPTEPIASSSDEYTKYKDESLNPRVNQDSIPPLTNAYIPTTFDLWRDSIARLLLSGQTLSEQALAKFKSTGNTNNLPALLRLHIPNFSSQWPLSLQYYPENKQAVTITSRERISDWMVLVARTITLSIVSSGDIDSDKKIEFIYNELILPLLNAPRQSYEMYLMLLHEIYHQIYIFKRKSSDADKSTYILLNKIYGEWSVDIANSIINNVGDMTKPDDIIIPLSPQHCEMVKANLLATVSDKAPTSANIGSNSNDSSNTNVRLDSALETLANFVPTSYESVLVNKSLIMVENDLIVKFVSIKSNSVILGKLKDNLLGRYVLDVPTLGSNLIKTLQEGLGNTKSGSIICLSALFGIYKNKPKYEKNTILLLLTNTAIPDRTARLNTILMVKRAYSKYHKIIDDYAITNLKTLGAFTKTSEENMDVDKGQTRDQTQGMEEEQKESKMKTEFFIAIMSLNFSLVGVYFEQYSKVDSRCQLLMRRSITPLIRQISVADESEILYKKDYKALETVVEESFTSCPAGSESLLLRIIILVLEKEKEHSKRFMINIEKMIQFINERNLDGRYLIPILGRMKKSVVIENLGKLVMMLDGSDEMNNLFKVAIRKVTATQRASSEQISKEEIIVEFHYMSPNEAGGLKKFVGGLQVLLGLDIFDPTVLGSSLKAIINSERKLPIVLMRSLMMAHKLYPVMKSYLARLLGMLVTNSLPGSKNETGTLYEEAVWDNEKLWSGFLLCFNLLKPHSYKVLSSIPEDKQALIFEKYPEIKTEYENTQISSQAPDQVLAQPLDQDVQVE